MGNFILSIILLVLTSRNPVQAVLPAQTHVLASHAISLEDRQPNSWVNNVFKENILLTIAYGRQVAVLGEPVDWNRVNAPFHWSLELSPGKGFAFHNMIMPKYQNQTTPWSDIHFYISEGFLSDGWLIGDGVCHLASLLDWVAKDAGLAVEAPTNHNFAAIPEIAKEYGVAIYYDPSNLSFSEAQNLYIVNNKDVAVQFVFDYDGTNLQIKLEELL